MHCRWPLACKPFFEVGEKGNVVILRGPSLLFTALVTIPSILFFGAVTLLGFPIDIWVRRSRMSHGHWGPVATWVKTRWTYWMIWVHGIKVQVEGMAKEEVRAMRGVVFVANHQSVLDIPVDMNLLPENTAFLAKKELRKFPIFGWAAECSGTLYINRSKGMADETIARLPDFIQKGFSIILYPEGTRSTDGNLLPFKRGAFMLAINAQVPIVPIINDGTYRLCPKGRLAIAPGVVNVYVEKPIPTKGLTPDDRHRLSEEVATIMRKRLEKMRENRNNEGRAAS